MKKLLITLLSLTTLTLNAQDMKTPQEVVTQLFVATDQEDWNTVESIFNSEVLLDYSSMNGNPASTLSPTDITTAWKSILPGFEQTHHQIGNLLVKENGDQAMVFCYGTATHYLKDEKGNLWTVVGSYDFDLMKVEGSWKISSMKFNYKYQDGNASLAEKAMNKLK